MFAAMSPKQRVAEAAVAYIQSGMSVGLGTGSTAEFFIAALGAALRDGKVRDLRAVPTSVQSERQARELGIPLVTLGDCPMLDVTVDGADEIDPQLNLIKGLGGALLREKIVAQNSRKLIIIADDSKVVPKLGSKSPLPVEVAPFSHEAQARLLESLGATATLRRSSDGKIFATDNANYIYDCRFASAIADVRNLDEQLSRRAGVVESGLFLGMAALALIATPDGVQTKTRASRA
jgi:ribose 5-phosphate isomerase A